MLSAGRGARAWSVRIGTLIGAALLAFAAAPANGFGQDRPEASPAPATIPLKQFPAAKAQDTSTGDTNAGSAHPAPDAAPGAISNEKDSPEAIRRRAEWFYKQRSSVSGHIPAGAHLQALQHMQRMMEAEGKLLRRADGSYAPAEQPSGGTAWAPVGPTPTTGGIFSPVTGRITTIAVDPSDSTGNTLLIGGAQGGIWRSTDAGITWTPVGDQNASLAMGSIAFAPSSPSTVYAGTGEQASIGFDIYYGAGVLKSMDGGITWAQTCTTPSPSCPFIGPYTDEFFGSPGFGYFNFGGARISYISVSPSNSNLLLAATQFVLEGPMEGVYCSQDGGATWSNVLSGEMATFVGFAASGTAYAALGNPYGSSPGAPHPNGIYKATGISSTCSSISFKPVPGSGLPQLTSLGRIDLGIAPSDPNTIYASISGNADGSSTNLGVFVSTNGGANWTKTAAPDVCQFQCWYDNVVKVDPNNKSIAFFGGAAVITSSGGAPSWVVRTQNAGTNWSTVIPNSSPGDAGVPHVDTHALAFVKLPSGKVRLYLGNDGGIWRTDDAEAASITWTNLNNGGLTLSQFYPAISIHPSSPQIAFGGTQDNGSQNYQGGTAWVDNGQCGDGTSTGIDLQIPSTVYVTCPNFGDGFPVFASYQGGAPGTFFPANSGIDPNDSADFVAPLVVDPNAPNLLYFAGTSVYQSKDAGTSWNRVSPQLVGGALNDDFFTTLAVAPGNSSVAYLGSSAGTLYAGQSLTSTHATFTYLSTAGTSPARAITAIAVDPADPTGSTIYVAFSGFSFQGLDASGQTVSDPLGHIFKATATVQSSDQIMFVDVSCSVSNCSAPAAADLPNIPVNDLVLDPDVPGILYAATDLGVYVGDCSAAPCTWSTLGTGLPHVAVLSLRLHEASRTLRAATHGRGVWDLALNNFAFTGPRIFSLSPVSAAPGGSAVTLTVNGTGLSGGAVQWNGATTGVTTLAGGTDTTLTATLDPSLLIVGSAAISVSTVSAASNAVPFDVLAQTPTLTGINPPSVPVETPNPSSSAQIQLTGTNFGNGAKVYWNGQQSGITAVVNSSTSLTATLPAKLLGPVGSVDDISVINTPPGGGKSQVQAFRVSSPPPPNDNIAAALPINSLSVYLVEDSSGATPEATDPVPACVQQYTAAQGNTGGLPNGAYNTVWYTFLPLFSAKAYLDTVGSSYDTVLSVWVGDPGHLSLLTCNDDITPGVVTQSRIQNLSLTAGTTYYFMVSSFGPPDPNPLALGGMSALNFSYNQGETPPPVLTSLSPISVSSGGPNFTLTVSGTGFLNGATVWFTINAQGVYHLEPTTFVSSSQVTATIPAADISLPGAATVYVYNPLPTQDLSNGETFTVTLGTYPPPVLTSINPSSVVAGSLSLNLIAEGSDFAPAATVNLNGIPLPVNPAISRGPQEILVTVPASALATPGMAQVTVVNPAPGGGTSSPLPLNITVPTVVPAISSVSPSSFPSSSPPANLTITGTNFLPSAQATLNGEFLPYSSMSSTQIVAILLSAPSQPGMYPLYVTDLPPAGTSAPFLITVTGPPDFTLSPQAPSVTVTAGSTAMVPLNIQAADGFSGTVTVTCSVSAPASNCEAIPKMVSAGGSTTLSITTTARTLLPPRGVSWRIPQYGSLFFVPIALLLWFIAASRLGPARLRPWNLSLPLAVLALYFLLQLSGCGGGGSTGGGGGGGGGSQQGTPAGNYTLIIIGSSGTTSHQIAVPFTVN